LIKPLFIAHIFSRKLSSFYLQRKV